jgi:hypothetical protein
MPLQTRGTHKLLGAFPTPVRLFSSIYVLLPVWISVVDQKLFSLEPDPAPTLLGVLDPDPA